MATMQAANWPQRDQARFATLLVAGNAERRILGGSSDLDSHEESCRGEN
jgi:hypothetical protein